VCSWQVDQAKLRKMARLPMCSLKINFGDVGGCLVDARTRNGQKPLERITELEKQLKGDASDAERDLELAGLCEDTHRARGICEAAYARARAHFKERLQAEPSNGWLHAQYAEALYPHIAEAEAQALEAVRCAPGDYRCWQALGRVRY